MHNDSDEKSAISLPDCEKICLVDVDQDGIPDYLVIRLTYIIPMIVSFITTLIALVI